MKKKNQSKFIIFKKSSFFISITFLDVSKSKPLRANKDISFL